MTSSASELPSIPDFDFDPRTRVVFGAGVLSRLGEFARELGGRRVLLVTDAGLKAAGHEARAVDILHRGGMDVSLFDEVQPNPTTDEVDRGTAFAKERSIDLIVGLGGGSSMDCAKGINFLLTNGGRMEDYWGVGKATRPMLPMIAVPTTAGTGSEAQSFAVISHAKTHAKMACGDKKAAVRVALLDPELTLTMPANVTAVTGIDAISHAVESYVCTKRNPVSQMFARRAWRMLSRAFPVVIREPQNLTARGGMLIGSHLAGAAIENSMLGATHALANPVTAHFGVTHGIAIGILLPHVVRYNGTAVESLYRNLVVDAGADADHQPPGDALSALLRRMTADSGSPVSLEECGVEKQALTLLAKEASEQWTGKFNPRPAGADQFEELYRCAFHRA